MKARPFEEELSSGQRVHHFFLQDREKISHGRQVAYRGLMLTKYLFWGLILVVALGAAAVLYFWLEGEKP